MTVACDLIPYPLLLKDKGDVSERFSLFSPLSFRRGAGGEVAGHGRPGFGKPSGGLHP